MRKIGIDLDNTILSYDELFHKLAKDEAWIPEDCPVQKKSVADSIRNMNPTEGENRWQELQQRAYGRLVDKAELYKGFEAFVKDARTQHHHLFIVSHKSEELREAALGTLKKRGFFEPTEKDGLGFDLQDIYFVSSLEEKVEMIKRLEVQIFIDDLPKVFEEPGFPFEVRKFLFVPHADFEGELETFRSWDEIQVFINLLQEVEHSFSKHLSDWEIIASGNSSLRKVEWEDRTVGVLKSYWSQRGEEDSKRRCGVEFIHMQALWKVGFRNIPQPLWCREGAALYSYIHGVRPLSVSENEVDQLIGFAKDLQTKTTELEQFPVMNARESRFCLKEYPEAIQRRWQSIEAGCAHVPHGKEILKFLKEELMPLRKVIEKAFLEKAQSEGLDLERKLTKDEIMFSPSDFGFHNTILDDKKRLYFLDFEYSGWDDPAKLFADFFHHVGHNISSEIKQHVLDAFSKFRTHDKRFLPRWRTVMDIIGLEWVLIVLNVADPVTLKRKQMAGRVSQPEALIDTRLLKAKRLAERIKACQS